MLLPYSRSARGATERGFRLAIDSWARPALVLLVLLVAGCTTGPTPRLATPPPSTQPILPDDTAPRDVLAVFLKTLLIGDCAAARELSTQSGFLQVGGFCGRIHVVDFAIVGDGASVAPDAMRFATALTIEGGGDVLTDGDHTIFFSLGRQPNGPWRVTGGGSGP